MTESSIGVAIVICPIPRALGQHEAAAWMARGHERDVPVTWAIPLDMLAGIRAVQRDSVGASAAVAVDLSDAWPLSRQHLRQSLRMARAAWPALEAAVLHGPCTLDHRDVLVQEGITTIGVDRFDIQQRGSRRPSPRGWACRSVVWGLWEVATSPPQQGILGSIASRLARRHGRGGLTVWNAGPAAATTVRARLDRQVAWIRRRSRAGTLRAVRLSDLPAVVTGVDPAASGGSVLRAA